MIRSWWPGRTPSTWIAPPSPRGGSTPRPSGASTTRGRTETTSRRSAKRGSGRSATTRRVWRRGSRPRPRASRWWPRWVTGRSAPPTSVAGRGSWAWRGEPTRTPGATAPAIPRRGPTAPPWPNWPGPRRWRCSPRPSWSRWGSGYRTSAGTGPPSWRGCTRSIRTISGPP